MFQKIGLKKKPLPPPDHLAGTEMHIRAAAAAFLVAAGNDKQQASVMIERIEARLLRPDDNVADLLTAHCIREPDNPPANLIQALIELRARLLPAARRCGA
ncbi:MAG: hypothetical protein U5P41_14435 [Gammaproteobacteria bacterium]|nr:hypothetical protein [Gammaproteobacteria bacterium]